MINRYSLVTRHNPKLNMIDYESPLTVGNGEFAFTADVTGLQTLYEEYETQHVPLCTMSQWGWHSEPAGVNRDIYYKQKDLKMTKYSCIGRNVTYAVEKIEGNEEVYDWLRQNPHRLNLARIAFQFEGKEIKPADLSHINQVLDLYEGCLKSSFLIQGYPVEVITVCDSKKDALAFFIKSDALINGKLKAVITFPYGSPDITASNWNMDSYHSTRLLDNPDSNCISLHRRLDKDFYYAAVRTDCGAKASITGTHRMELKAGQNVLNFTVQFSKKPVYKPLMMNSIRRSSKEFWKNFWENGAAVDMHLSKDKRAWELERRIVLSQYLTAVQSCGSMPPQETGLTCNSWYGKFHLEMYFWHCAYLPLWNRTDMLKKSLTWYKKTLLKAKKNAERNGYLGAKWPKMVAYNGIDSPSPIATLLIWQQPHIIYMLELVYQNEHNDSILEEYWNVIYETAEYMRDFAVYNQNTIRYDLPSPLIPAQEEHDPNTAENPAFELEYWSFALLLAAKWAERLGLPGDKWRATAKLMAELPEKNGLYIAHKNCPQTYEKFNRDHPSMLAVMGLLPGYRADKKIMEASLNHVLECWDFSTMWGWDFAMMAMTAVRLGKPELAIDILMMDTPKNSYVTSGNNYQKLREDLPLYLPGNGSLLLAVTLMIAGYRGCKTELPGFPKNGLWEVEYENMEQFPY